MIPISTKSTVYHLVTTYPELKKILFSLGFEQIVNPAMLKTVGRIMTLEKGCIMKNISLNELNTSLLKYDFQLLEINEKEDTNEPF